ncbi:MAG: Gfo/Idh/MocA family oxidoreductase [Nitrososphaera sp.]
MKFLVMGCGSIGERHIRNLLAEAPGSSIDAFDPQKERLKVVAEKYHVAPAGEEMVDSRYDCVLVCTPPSSHVELATRAARAGSNVLVEKPLSSGMQGVRELRSAVKEKGILAFVAYNFRFNRGINTVKEIVSSRKFGRVLHASAYFGQYLPDWRPWQDYAKSYTARKELGGGIIHDGSHEIDYLVWLFGRPKTIQSQFAYTDTLSADTEAMADIILQFDGTLGSIHLDFVRREYRRSLELLCENAVVQWSLSEDAVRTFDPASKSWSSQKLGEDVNEMYLAEIRHVLGCIKERKKSGVIDLENGISTLELSDAVHRSGLEGRRLAL